MTLADAHGGTTAFVTVTFPPTHIVQAIAHTHPISHAHTPSHAQAHTQPHSPPHSPPPLHRGAGPAAGRGGQAQQAFGPGPCPPPGCPQGPRLPDSVHHQLSSSSPQRAAGHCPQPLTGPDRGGKPLGKLSRC